MEPADATAEPSSSSSSALPSARNDKRERKHTAQTLPPGITQQMMKKFVVYYREFVNLKNGKRVPREYFKVESHPKLSRPWLSSKSSKISLLEKLEAANQVVTELEKNSAPDAPDAAATPITDLINKNLPKYTKIRVVKDNLVYALVYDQKDNCNGFRWTCSHTFRLPVTPECPTPFITETIISLELQNLKDKLYDKYAVDLLDDM
jgi:hypothetical protein